MEIERKFLIRELPEDLESFPSEEIEQVYLLREPVIRIRKTDSHLVLTVKGDGMLSREELNLPLSKEAYQSLLKRAESRVIRKRRYQIPYQGLLIELDVFSGFMEGLVMAEVEFESVEQAEAFCPPEWFSREVTYDPAYHNVNMAYCS